MRGGGLIAPSLGNISQFCFPGQKRKLFTPGSTGIDGGRWKKQSTEKTEYTLQPLPWIIEENSKIYSALSAT